MDTARSWTRQETIVLPRADAHARRERRRARQWLWHVVLRVEARGARLKGSDLNGSDLNRSDLNGSDLNEAPASSSMEPEPLFIKLVLMIARSFFLRLGRRVERVERAGIHQAFSCGQEKEQRRGISLFFAPLRIISLRRSRTMSLHIIMRSARNFLCFLAVQ